MDMGAYIGSLRGLGGALRKVGDQGSAIEAVGKRPMGLSRTKDRGFDRLLEHLNQFLPSQSTDEDVEAFSDTI